LFFARRYPLGAIGAIIPILFLATPSSPGSIAVRPIHDQCAHIAGSARQRAHPRRRLHGLRCSPRIVRARISLSVSVSATARLPDRRAIGLMSSLRRLVRSVVQRVLDIMQSLPLLVMALVMAACWGRRS
jgi:peptide/nickel transport system permease protein